MSAPAWEHMFAWRPVRTEDRGVVWLRRVYVQRDDRPVEYLGLTPEVRYLCDAPEVQP